MPPILTAEDVVKRIAAECAFVADRGGVGIRLKTGGDRLCGSTESNSAPPPDGGNRAARRERHRCCELV
jgi:hypothetical protein